MRILILGAGAIGGCYGLRLAEAGVDVIQQGALRLEAEQEVGDLRRCGRRHGLAAPILDASVAQLQVYDARGAA